MPDIEVPVRVHILGALRIWRQGAEVDAGPRQQALLLAVLAARAGQPTATAELVDLIWGDQAPASAVNVVHKYIGILRRLLEPSLHTREPGSLILRRANTYLLAAGPDNLDLLDFREAAAAAAAERDEHAALDHYVRALTLWSGPAAGALAEETATETAVFTTLNDEFLAACTTAAELATTLGRPEQVIAPVRLAAGIAPLNEPVQAALVRLLAAAGRQAEALAAFRAVRGRLVRDLGLDPGPALERAQQQVLAGAAAQAFTSSRTLVGRTGELALFAQAMDEAFAGRSAVVMVEGEPGVGKTRLLEELAVEAGRRAALVVWGRCLEGDGTPSMWPWVQVVDALLRSARESMKNRWLNSDLVRLVEPNDDFRSGSVMPDSGTQFRLFELVAEVLREISARRPCVVVIDDLHWADIASLHLFHHLASRLADGAVLIGALRSRAPVPDINVAHLLAAVNRVPGYRRVGLGLLDVAEVAQVIAQELGRSPDAEAAAVVHRRTEGNPFFVRELTRLLASNGRLTAEMAQRPGVPSTVRDVVRDRVMGLADESADVVRTASLIGRETRVELLARAAGLSVETCLRLMEPLQASSLLERNPSDPFSCRFTHDLIRESISALTPSWQANQVHLHIADALESLVAIDDSETERLAYHLWSAGPLADPGRTARALVSAAGCAARKSALESAERLLRQAVDVARNARLPEEELSALSQLTAVVGMRSMYATSDPTLLQRAEDLARNLGREMEATAFLYSRWVAHAQGIQLERSVPLARRLLEQGQTSTNPVVRAYGLQAWGIVQWHLGNIDDAIRYLRDSERTLLDTSAFHDDDPVRRDLHALMTGVLAEVTTLHGEVEAGRALLDSLAAAAGDNPYRLTVWASMAARIAGIVGDTTLALEASHIGLAADPGFSFVYLGTYQRLARCWADVLTGDDPEQARTAIVEAERLIATNLLNPPRSCVATWTALLAEMYMATGALEEAGDALQRATAHLEAYGQRYPEGLVELLAARLLLAARRPVEDVRAAAEQARALSLERGAGLFARRAADFLATLA
jgi:DNA-binding SARP family transcriptional activator/tetratricopeptide (TPR) repeat protein